MTKPFLCTRRKSWSNSMREIGRCQWENVIWADYSTCLARSTYSVIHLWLLNNHETSRIISGALVNTRDSCQWVQRAIFMRASSPRITRNSRAQKIEYVPWNEPLGEIVRTLLRHSNRIRTGDAFGPFIEVNRNVRFTVHPSSRPLCTINRNWTECFA